VPLICELFFLKISSCVSTLNAVKILHTKMQALISGNEFFGLQFGEECWLGNDYATAVSLGTSSGCNMDCPGNLLTGLSENVREIVHSVALFCAVLTRNNKIAVRRVRHEYVMESRPKFGHSACYKLVLGLLQQFANRRSETLVHLGSLLVSERSVYRYVSHAIRNIDFAQLHECIDLSANG